MRTDWENNVEKRVKKYYWCEETEQNYWSEETEKNRIDEKKLKKT